MRQALRYSLPVLISLLLVATGAMGAQAAPVEVGKIRVTFSTPEGVPGLLTLDGKTQQMVASKATAGTDGEVDLTAPVGNYSLDAKPVMGGTKRYVAVADPLRNVQVKPNTTTTVKVTYSLSRGIQDAHQVGIASDSVTLAWTAPAGTSVQVRRTV